MALCVRLSQYSLPSVGMLKIREEMGEVAEGDWEGIKVEGQKRRAVHQPSLISIVFVHWVCVCVYMCVRVCVCV